MLFNSKRILSLLLIFALVLGLTFTPVANVSFAEDTIESEPVNITIVHTNDTHARVKSDSSSLGFAKISTKIKELKSVNPNVLVLDAGDAFHGQTIASLLRGESIVRVMNAVGYDAMVAGNHDFNYGQDRLLELAKMANFPILAANVIKSNGDTLLPPYTIKEISGVKVAIFGLATPETTYKTHPNNVKGLAFEDPVKVAKAMVEELKDKADIIIALSHLGMDDSSTDTSIRVAEEVEGIDIIVDGHSHTTLPEGMKVGNTLIVQAGEYDKNLGIVDLVYADGKITAMNASLLTNAEAENLAEDQNLINLVKEIEEEISKITSVIIGKSAVQLDGAREMVRAGETNLGNLIADAILKATSADIALTNGGGIRASIESGDVTKGDVITVLPFGNYVVVKNIKGSDILAALEHGVKDYPNAAGHFPQVAGITFRFDASKEAGSRIVDVKVAGKPLDLNRNYKLATNDFLAAGGDMYSMFKEGEILAQYPGLDEILIDYIAQYGTANAKVDGRIQEGALEEVVKTAETYVVKPGDVLWRIAKKFGLTWEALSEFNNLVNPHRIFPGQKILIPIQ